MYNQIASESLGDRNHEEAPRSSTSGQGSAKKPQLSILNAVVRHFCPMYRTGDRGQFPNRHQIVESGMLRCRPNYLNSTAPSPRATYRLRCNLPPMQVIEGRHELGQIELMFLGKARLSEAMIGIPGFPVVPGTKGYSREVRRLLSRSLGAQRVRVGRFDKDRLAAHFRTDYASQRPNPGQVIRASVRTPTRPGSPRAKLHSSFRRQTPRQRHTPA